MTTITCFIPRNSNWAARELVSARDLLADTRVF